jgi:hypothetical protein
MLSGYSGRQRGFVVSVLNAHTLMCPHLHRLGPPGSTTRWWLYRGCKRRSGHPQHSNATLGGSEVHVPRLWRAASRPTEAQSPRQAGKLSGLDCHLAGLLRAGRSKSHLGYRQRHKHFCEPHAWQRPARITSQRPRLRGWGGRIRNFAFRNQTRSVPLRMASRRAANAAGRAAHELADPGSSALPQAMGFDTIIRNAKFRILPPQPIQSGLNRRTRME